MSTSLERRDPLNLLLMIASILALMLAMGAFITISTLGVITWFVDTSTAGAMTLVIAAAFFVMGLCTIPGIFYGYRGTQGKIEIRKGNPLQGWMAVILLFPLSLGLGYLAFNRNILPAILGPLAHISAAILPVIFALAILFRKGSPISAKRTWGQFLAGLWASPVVAFFVEVVAAVTLVVILFVTMFQELNSTGIFEDFSRPEQWTEPYLVTQAQELFNQPWILILIVAFLILFVPMVEEAIKTIGIWPVVTRGFSQSQAFIGGAIAGAGYGLFEAFFLGQPGVSWAPVMIARAGATLMHMVTTAITGLGIARAREKGRWSTAIGYYFGAVFLHSLWNVAALGVGAIMLIQQDLAPIDLNRGLSFFSAISGAVLITLSILAFLGIWLIPGGLLKREAEFAAQIVDLDGE